MQPLSPSLLIKHYALLAKFKVEHYATRCIYKRQTSRPAESCCLCPVNCIALLVWVVSFWFGTRLTSLSLSLSIEWICVYVVLHHRCMCVCVLRARLAACGACRGLVHGRAERMGAWVRANMLLCTCVTVPVTSGVSSIPDGHPLLSIYIGIKYVCVEIIIKPMWNEHQI